MYQVRLGKEKSSRVLDFPGGAFFTGFEDIVGMEIILIGLL